LLSRKGGLGPEVGPTMGTGETWDREKETGEYRVKKLILGTKGVHGRTADPRGR